MFRQVSIRNFKCLRNVQIDLERFTILVGPNASGKTSILQSLNHLCRLFREQRPSDDQLLQATTQGEHTTNKFVELEANFGGERYRYQTPFQGEAVSSPRGTKWSGKGRGMKAAGSWQQWPPVQNSQPPVPPPSPLPASVLLRLESSKLNSPSAATLMQLKNAPPPDPKVMDPDGTNLHTSLAHMALKEPDSWQQLQEALRKVIPSIRRIRFTSVTNPALLFDTISADSLPANQVSEGTLLVLGLLAALYAPGRPSLVLLDDLDRGLHPRAQRELISLLRSLLTTNADIQILATTHSPYMLDCMETNEVRMTLLGDDGWTVCSPLSSHPDFARWKDEMTPGEMWSMFGEKWMIEQGATA